MSRVRLGELLQSRGLCSREQLSAAWEHKVLYGDRLGTNLLALGHVDEATLARVLGEQHGVHAGYGGVLKVDPDAIALIPSTLAAKRKVVPHHVAGRVLYLLMSDPDNLRAIDEVRFATRLRVQPIVVCEARLWRLLSEHYGVDVSLRPNPLDAQVRPGAAGAAAPSSSPPPPTEDLVSEEAFQQMYASLASGAHPTAEATEHTEDTAAVVADPPGPPPPVSAERIGGAAAALAAAEAIAVAATVDATASPAVTSTTTTTTTTTTTIDRGPELPAFAVPDFHGAPADNRQASASWLTTDLPPVPSADPPGGAEAGAPAVTATFDDDVISLEPEGRGRSSEGLPEAHTEVTGAVPTAGFRSLAIAAQESSSSSSSSSSPIASSLSPPADAEDWQRQLAAVAPVRAVGDTVDELQLVEVVDEPETIPPDAPSPWDIGTTTSVILPPPARTPLSFDEAVAALRDVSDRDDIARIVLRAARSRFRRAGLLTAYPHAFVGWQGLGEGFEDLASVRIPRTVESVFALVSESRAHYIGPLQRFTSHGAWVKATGRKVPRSLAVFPILVRGRTVNLLVVDNGHDAHLEQDASQGGVSEILILARHIAASYETLIATGITTAT